MLNGLIAVLIGDFIRQLGYSASYVIHAGIAIIFNYVIPVLAAALIFQSFENYAGKLRIIYKKPKQLARALGSFPAMYGLGFGTALLTLLASFLLSKVTVPQSVIEDLFKPTALELPAGIVGALIMVFMLVVIAPVFEEIWVRGIMYGALKPYGSGMAIIISSVLFGLMHGNLQMLFYTTALGFALGYIRYATDSLFAVTILHAIINSVTAGFLFISSLVEITDSENRLINTILNIYLLAWLVLVLVGIITFIAKIPAIRKYRIDNAWPDIGAGKKTALFFLSIPVIIMLVLAVNEHTNYWLLNQIW